jgi:hypothetical protein
MRMFGRPRRNTCPIFWGLPSPYRFRVMANYYRPRHKPVYRARVHRRLGFVSQPVYGWRVVGGGEGEA